MTKQGMPHSFSIKCISTGKLTEAQFRELAHGHLRKESYGLMCDLLEDWDGETLFWQTCPLDIENEDQSMSFLRRMVRRYLTETGLKDADIDQYVRFETYRYTD